MTINQPTAGGTGPSGPVSVRPNQRSEHNRSSRRWLSATKLGAGLLGICGAVLLLSGTAFAHHGGGGHRGHISETVLELLGGDVDAVKTALAEDQTLEQIAQANGATLTQLLDAAVADITAKYTAAGLTLSDERVASLREKLETKFTTPRSERPARVRGYGKHLSDSVLELLGGDAEAVKAALAEDQTLEQIAQANGATLTQLLDAAVAGVTERYTLAGRELTEEQVASLREKLETKFTTPRSERPARVRGFGRSHRRGGFRGASVRGFVALPSTPSDTGSPSIAAA